MEGGDIIETESQWGVQPTFADTKPVGTKTQEYSLGRGLGPKF